MIDLRVGKILDSQFRSAIHRLWFLLTDYFSILVKVHPDADGLYIEVCWLPTYSARIIVSHLDILVFCSKSTLVRRPDLERSSLAWSSTSLSNKCGTSISSVW